MCDFRGEGEKRFSEKIIKFISTPADEQLTPFVSRNQREKVRQFIEELLAKMLDGPLDDVPVVQLSSSEHCEYLYEKIRELSRELI